MNYEAGRQDRTLRNRYKKLLLIFKKINDISKI